MFADTLDAKEKQSIVELMIFIAQADGNLNDEEIEFLNTFCKRIGYTGKILVDSKFTGDLKDVCSSFTSIKTKKIALIELLNIAYSDSIYSETEKKGIAKIAKSLGLTVKELKQAEAIIEEGVKWLEKGSKFVNG